MNMFSHLTDNHGKVSLKMQIVILVVCVVILVALIICNFAGVFDSNEAAETTGLYAAMVAEPSSLSLSPAVQSCVCIC